MNSPWGYLGQVAMKTGWSLDYILWKVNRVNIDLMLSDQPYLSKKKDQDMSKEGVLDFLKDKYKNGR
ncbi:hypothetical protein [Roseivirga sp. UBA838]|uniref:hypothetical protein n=1 Tax=Roseivirga sp. UBA838 TaxID=1947393 RepID=UPI00258062BC|nr:hypothetical protein [Roseivirga sp. UBA838]|tara:strand:+ start:21922 stop:22122 length:201 start_codon:yes stop_codon:yes gene_type:complete